MFLLVSELSLFRPYFARSWPLLSPSHGFVTLALAMIVLGINMLGNLNKYPTSQASLGLAFWRIVIGSGIIIFILGFVNLIAVSADVPRSLIRPLADSECRATSSATAVRASQHAKYALTAPLPSIRHPCQTRGRPQRQSSRSPTSGRQPRRRSQAIPSTSSPPSVASRYCRPTTATRPSRRR